MGKKWDKLDGVGTGGATFTGDGMGKGFKALPSYTGSPNPLCLNCGGSKRGRDRKGFRVCRCDTPSFPNIGKKQGQRMQEWHTRWLREVFRVLTPGGQLGVFGGTRVYHRLAAAMEQVGFIFDPAASFRAWTYGSGFPKSMDVGKAIDAKLLLGSSRPQDQADLADLGLRETIGERPGISYEGAIYEKPGREHTRTRGDTVKITKPTTEEARRFDGWGTSTKPAWEPILVGRKP